MFPEEQLPLRPLHHPTSAGGYLNAFCPNALLKPEKLLIITIIIAGAPCVWFLHRGFHLCEGIHMGAGVQEQPTASGSSYLSTFTWILGDGSLSICSLAFELPDLVHGDLGRRRAHHPGPLPLRPPAQDRPQPRPPAPDQLWHLHHHVHLPPLRHHEEGDIRIRGQLPTIHPYFHPLPHPYIFEVHLIFTLSIHHH